MGLPARLLSSFLPVAAAAAPPRRLLRVLVAGVLVTGEFLCEGKRCSVFPETTCILRLLTDEGGGTLFHCLDPRLRNVLERGMLPALSVSSTALLAGTRALAGPDDIGRAASGSFWRAFWSICSNDSCCPAARMTWSSGSVDVAGLPRGVSLGGVGGGGGGTMSVQDGLDGVIF